MTIPLALYVHIPFCAYRCRYCNFTFETGWSPLLMQRTLDALVAEAQTLVERGNADGFEWQVQTLYLGGGTPSVVPPELLVPFLARLERVLGYRTADLEATIEVNPENVSSDTLSAWAEAGLNRLSVGVQTFDSDRLALLGRWCDGPANRAALEIISTQWKGRWSGDLMTGLPGSSAKMPQRWVDLRADLNELLSYKPGHVSLYSLTVEPGTELAQLVDGGGAKVPADPVSDELWLRARRTLLDLGFDWYEISNFAKPGQRSAHNQAYWRMDWWAGLGPGAEGTLPARGPRGDLRPLRTHNPKLFSWLTGQRDETALTAAEFALEHYIAGWRTSDGIASGRLRRWFSPAHFPHPDALSDEERLKLNQKLARLEFPKDLSWADSVKF